MSGALHQRQLTVAEQVKADFNAYWSSVEKNRLDDPVSQRSLIASAHKYASCFSYISRSLTAQPQPLGAHERIFFQELTSDAVHLVHALTGGDARGARFYLRSVIENFWRHHYFRNHVIEYGWLDSRSKYFLEMKDLREHCSYLPCFQYELKDLLGDLSALYSKLSVSVHSSSSKTMVLRQTLQDIRFSREQVQDMRKDVLDTLKACLALCMFSERDVYFGLSLEVQAYLMDALSVKHKKAVRAVIQRTEAALTESH
jgi:hypothetical protein